MTTRDLLRLSSNPLGLVEIMRDYGVYELGALFVYLPLPRRAEDREAWAWIEGLHLLSAVAGGPWRIESGRGSSRLQASHPHLFFEDLKAFEVYRIDRARLEKLLR